MVIARLGQIVNVKTECEYTWGDSSLDEWSPQKLS